MSFMSSFDALAKDQAVEWKAVLFQSAIACRCGVDAWAPEKEPDCTQIPEERREKAMKCIDK